MKQRRRLIRLGAWSWSRSAWAPAAWGLGGVG